MVMVKLDHPKPLRILYVVGEHVRPGLEPRRFHQHRHQVVAEEDVVAQDQAHRALAQEVLADEKGLGDAARAGLHLVRQRQSQVAAVGQQLFDPRRVAGRADDQDVADAGEHQHRKRVVNDRFIINGQQLLADRARQRVQPAAAAPGEQDGLHGGLLSTVNQRDLSKPAPESERRLRNRSILATPEPGGKTWMRDPHAVLGSGGSAVSSVLAGTGWALPPPHPQFLSSCAKGERGARARGRRPPAMFWPPRRNTCAGRARPRQRRPGLWVYAQGSILCYVTAGKRSGTVYRLY